jgi:hypothetical protein
LLASGIRLAEGTTTPLQLAVSGVRAHLTFTRSLGDIPEAIGTATRGALRFRTTDAPWEFMQLQIAPTGPAVLDTVVPPRRFELSLGSAASDTCATIGCGAIDLGTMDFATETARTFDIPVVRVHLQLGPHGVQSPTLPPLWLGSSRIAPSTTNDVDVIAGQYFLLATHRGECAPDRAPWEICATQVLGCE